MGARAVPAAPARESSRERRRSLPEDVRLVRWPPPSPARRIPAARSDAADAAGVLDPVLVAGEAADGARHGTPAASRGSRPSRIFSNPRNKVPTEEASTTCWTPRIVSTFTSTLRWPSIRVIGSIAIFAMRSSAVSCAVVSLDRGAHGPPATTGGLRVPQVAVSVFSLSASAGFVFSSSDRGTSFARTALAICGSVSRARYFINHATSLTRMPAAMSPVR